MREENLKEGEWRRGQKTTREESEQILEQKDMKDNRVTNEKDKKGSREKQERSVKNEE